MSLDRLRKRAKLVAELRQKDHAAKQVPEGLARRKTEADTSSPPRPPRQPPRGNKLDLLRKQSRLLENPRQFDEINRIVGMPIIPEMTPEEVEEFNRTHLLADAYDSGFRLWEAQCRAINAYELFGGLFAPIGVGWGKCVRGSAKVLTEAQGLVSLSSLAGTEFRTPSFSDTGCTTWSEAKAFESGEKLCAKLWLDSGHEVEASLDHPILTPKGYVELGKLKRGDLVAVARRLPEGPGLRVADEEIELLAFLMADGSTSQGAVSLTSMPGPVVDRLVDCARQLGCGATVVPERSKAVRVNLTKALPITRRWKIQGCLSKQKRMSPELLKATNRQLALWVNRFWATDGHVGKDRLEITLASKGLTQDLQHALTRLGILSRFRYKKSGGFDAWRLVVSGREIENFLNVVGVPLGQKERVKVLRGRPKGSTNTDAVPITRGDHVAIAEWLGVGCTYVRSELGLTTGQWLSREKWERFVEDHGYDGPLAHYAYDDLAWVKVRAIEETGYQPVYDLEVPGDHNWVADGVVVHNTLITQAVAAAAFRKGLKRVLLLVPSQVLYQLVHRDFPFARKRIPIPYPVHVLGGRPMRARRALAKSGKRGLYVLPYSCLSTKDAHDNLMAIRPQLIIGDEADKLGNMRAARTRRIMGYVRDHKPEGGVLSGTITSKTIRDYYHLIKWCLGQNCPLPVSSHLANEWASKIDAQAASSDATGPIRPLVDWAQEHFPSEPITLDTAGFRLAYKLRLKTTPGVVSTGDADIGPSLVVHNTPVEGAEETEGWETLEQLKTQVVDAWLTPNGDEIEHAIHTYKWLYELSAGFYNELTWPEPARFADREEISLAKAETILDEAQAHHGIVQLYHKGLRSWLEDHGRPGLDTPMLVAGDMAKHRAKNVGYQLYELWGAARESEEDLLALLQSCTDHSEKELRKRIARSLRDSRIVRVCPYKVDHAVSWAADHRGGSILWVWHQGIGMWLTEALRNAGLDPLYCPAGAEHNEAILDPANSKRTIVASMKAHGTGKNLQAFNQQLFVQWPRNAKIAEQTLGRMHRNGQTADEVWAHTCSTGDFDDFNFAATLNDALYIHQTTGNRQKLIYATYSPRLPKVFPSEVLRERGFQNRRLTVEQERLMAERFDGE